MKTRTDLVELAKNYATKFHKGQFRKDGKTPYIKHPAQVVKKLKKDFGIKDQYILAGAWLHDVVEEGGDLDEIHKIFGGKIADKVNLLTNWKSYGKDVDYILYTMKLKFNAPPDVKLIKYCDVMVNIADLKNIPKITKKERELYMKKRKVMLDKLVPDITQYVGKVEV
jgi:guanosine-3',5'-bis(diphosphate) 3'-pyrophosphohydrolase